MEEEVLKSVKILKDVMEFPEHDEPNAKPKKRSSSVEAIKGESDVTNKRNKIEGDLSTYSLEDLKQLCREAQLKVSGTKPQLIERLKGNV